MLTPKQTEYLKSKDNRINILYGSVRSGKTWISLLKWSLWIAQQPPKGDFIMIGRTLTTLKRNCLVVLEEIIGQSNITYSIPQKKAVIFGRTVWLEGAADARSEGKIRGQTLKGAYVDELTLIPEDFYLMLVSRLSLSGAKLFATTNPDSPKHYVKTTIIDNDEIDKNIVKFTLDENTFIEKYEREQIKKVYSASKVHWERFILGNFTSADGLIYSAFANNSEQYLITSIPPLMEISIGLDFGGEKSATAIVATGITANYKKLIVLASERYYNKDYINGITAQDVDKIAINFARKIIKHYGRCDYLEWDNESTFLGNSVKVAFEKANLPVTVRPCYKSTIKNRIDCTIRLIGEGRFFWTRESQTVKEALELAVWNPKEDCQRLDDGTTPIDDLDALEYTFSRSLNYFL